MILTSRIFRAALFPAIASLVLTMGCRNMETPQEEEDIVEFEISEVRLPEEYRMAEGCRMNVFGKGFCKGDSLCMVQGPAEEPGPSFTVRAAVFPDMLSVRVPYGMESAEYRLLIKRRNAFFELGTVPVVMGDEFRPKPRGVVAHRGYHEGKVPENSIEALRKAIDSGICGVEFDVRLTKDDIPIVIHEPKADQYEPLFEDMLGSEVDIYRLSNGEKIPTLYEFFTAIGDDRHTLLFMDFKDQTTDEKMYKLVDIAMAAVKRFELEDITSYMAFHWGAIMRMVDAKPKGYIGYLSWMADELDAVKAGTTMLPLALSHYMENPERLSRYKASGVLLNSGADTPEEIEWCLSNGIELLGNDEPSKLIPYFPHDFVEY